MIVFTLNYDIMNNFIISMGNPILFNECVIQRFMVLGL